MLIQLAKPNKKIVTFITNRNSKLEKEKKNKMLPKEHTHWFSFTPD